VWPLFFDVSAEFAPRPNRPIGVGILGLIERDGRFLVERRSDESEELRFFGREELGRLDVIETSRPILDAYPDPVPGRPQGVLPD
jgi:hypothetical protein